jgi:hypothetical protein
MMKPAAVLLVILLLASCVSRESALEDPPIITSATYQHTQYNGRGQPIEAAAAKDDVSPFVVTYFSSEDDYYDNKNGATEAPAEVGDYYVKIERPAGNGYKRGKDIKIEYHVQKAFITLNADPAQRFVYDGTPKEAAARAEPPVDLTVSYFAVDNVIIGNLVASALASPPTEKGRYRALISFAGNARYMGASKEIELLIE